MRPARYGSAVPLPSMVAMVATSCRIHCMASARSHGSSAPRRGHRSRVASRAGRRHHRRAPGRRPCGRRRQPPGSARLLYRLVRFADAARELGVRTVYGAKLSVGLTAPQNGAADPQGQHLLVLGRGEKKGRPVYDLEEIVDELRRHAVVLTGCRKDAVRQALVTETAQDPAVPSTAVPTGSRRQASWCMSMPRARQHPRLRRPVPARQGGRRGEPRCPLRPSPQGECYRRETLRPPQMHILRTTGASRLERAVPVDQWSIRDLSTRRGYRNPNKATVVIVISADSI